MRKRDSYGQFIVKLNASWSSMSSVARKIQVTAMESRKQSFKMSTQQKFEKKKDLDRK